MLVAADLQRPNAVQQLQVNGERVGVPVFAPEPTPGNGTAATRSTSPAPRSRRPSASSTTSSSSTPPVASASTQTLMQQAADIRDAVQPDEVLFVVDAMIGQDAVVTAQAFLDGVGFDGVVLTKLDGDARGGAALSIRSITGKPVMFASSGEKMTDFDTLPPRPDGLAHPRHGRHAHPDRAGREGLRLRAVDEGRREARHQGRLHPGGLPPADDADPQARLDDQDHGDAPRDGSVPRPARELRRARDRPHPGDHPVDDARPSATTPRSSTARAAPASPRAPAARSPTSTSSSTASSRRAR